MICTIYSTDNGLGLSRDTEIIKNIVQDMGIDVIVEHTDTTHKTDIAISLEIPNAYAAQRATKSIFIPNPDWYMWPISYVGAYSTVFCKSRLAYSLFSPHVPCTYVGFTSQDLFRGTPKRQACYHIYGGSNLKGTESVLQAWIDNPDLPLLTVRGYSRDFTDVVQGATNIDYHFGRLFREDIVGIQNRNLVAVQPSSAEGFGHVLWEALSTGSIVITTDAPPMNEVPGTILCPATGVGRHHLCPVYQVDPADIATAVRQVFSRRPDAMVSASVVCRKNWYENDQEFKTRFKEALYAVSR